MLSMMPLEAVVVFIYAVLPLCRCAPLQCLSTPKIDTQASLLAQEEYN